MYRNLGYPNSERLWHIAVAVLVLCTLFAFGCSSLVVPFVALELLEFCFCTLPFFADNSSTQWLMMEVPLTQILLCMGHLWDSVMLSWAMG